MMREKLSVRVLESVIAFAVAFLLAFAPEMYMSNASAVITGASVAADMICCAVAMFAVAFGIYNLAGRSKKAGQIISMEIRNQYRNSSRAA